VHKGPSTIHGLVVPVVNLHGAHLAIHTPGNPLDFDLQERLRIEPGVPQ
jgi:hypothetical protein